MAVNPLTTSTRINGISSGLDTESIVNSLLQYDKAKVTRQFQEMTKMEWKRDAYREINTTLKNFRQSYMSGLNQSNNMLSAAAYNIYKVTQLDSSNAVTLSANSNATVGNISIDKITQLATSAQVKSTNIFNSSTITYDAALEDLDLKVPLQFENDQISFSINGKTFSFGRDVTLSTMLNTINADSDAGVRISYSSLTNGFTITAKTTGASSSVNIANLTGNAFSPSNSAFGIPQGDVPGKNAKLIIDQVPVERETNSFTIDGISYVLKGASDTAITFNVDRDIDASVNMVKTFINAYNELIGSLQSKIDEQVYRDYPPLTDEQREAMSDSEVEKWDGRAKSGALKNDGNISSLLSTMRSAFYTKVGGVNVSAAEIGLKTGYYMDNGKITIDETALRTALEKNPDEVMKIFTNVSSSSDSKTKFSESGLITRISDAMNNYTEQVTTVSLQNLDRSISMASNTLDDLNTRMSDDEEKYWQKMTAMETAMAQLNSQSSWLTSQLANLNQ